MNFLNTYELPALDWIAEHLHCGFLDAVMPAITFLGNGGWFWIAIAAVMLIFKKTRKTGLMMGVALICGLLVGNMFLKPVVGRIRPYEYNEAIQLLIKTPHDYSFPSGHTLASFEGAVVLLLREKKYIGIPAVVLAALIAFSRMYLYVHYPTDIPAGTLLAVAFAFFGVWLVNKLWDHFAKKLKKA